MHVTIFRHIHFSLLLLISYTSFTQSQLSPEIYGRPRIPSPTSFYSQRYFFHDIVEGEVKYFAIEWKKIYPGRVNPFYLELHPIKVTEAVEHLDNPKKTLVCDASANLDEILTLDDPSLLSFNNGSVYVAVNNDIKYVSRLEFIGDNTLVSRHDLQKAMEDFSKEGFYIGLVADYVTVNFQPGQYIITGYKSTSSGKIYLYHRTNEYITTLENKDRADLVLLLPGAKYTGHVR